MSLRTARACQRSKGHIVAALGWHVHREYEVNFIQRHVRGSPVALRSQHMFFPDWDEQMISRCLKV